MITSGPARTAPGRIRIRRIRVVGLMVVIVAIAAVLGHESLGSPASTGSTPSSLTAPSFSTTAPLIGTPRSDHRGALGEADGSLPDATTVFDEAPGVVNLDPALLGALRRASDDAGVEGVRPIVDSGWRSAEYQEQLLRDAVSKYGSEEQAGRWVATPARSAHVSGDAVDVGPPQAAAWLSEHGARYGLCRIYGNEPWHFELRPQAVNDGCPSLYADPTHDPRVQK